MNKYNQIRSVVFDADGTLFDTLPSLAAAANEVLLEAGLQAVATVLMRPALNAGLRSMFRQAVALQPDKIQLDVAHQLEENFLSRYIEHWLPQATLFPGVAEVVTEFHALELKMAICTNRDRASTDQLLAAAGISGYIDVIVGIGDAPHPKPAPDPLLVTMERLRTHPEEALFIGDSNLDAWCAVRANVRFAAHLNGYASQPSDLFPRVFAFGDYSHLARWVLEPLHSNNETYHA